MFDFSMNAQKHKPKDTKTAIIDTAMKLFLQNGYDKVSLNDIAKEIGIKKPSIYYYFPGKKHRNLQGVFLQG